MRNVVEKLKELIDENGPKYLTEEPYKAYNELIKTQTADRKTAGALLMLFVSGITETVLPDDDLADLSKKIQRECCFNKKMADQLADILLQLHSYRLHRFPDSLDNVISRLRVKLNGASEIKARIRCNDR